MRWRAEPEAVLGFEKSSGTTVLLDLVEAARRLAAAPDDGLRRAMERAAHEAAPARSFAVPETMHVELSRHCPLACPACYPGPLEPASIPRERLNAILDEAIAAGVLQIAFGGGEPLLYPDLEDAIARVARHGLGATVTTSGWGATRARLAGLERAGLDHLQVSLSHVPGARDPRSQELAWDALAQAKAVGLPAGANVIVTHGSVPALARFLEQCRERGLSRVNLLRPKPSAGDPEWIAAHRLRSEDWAELAALVASTSGLALTLDSAMSPICGQLPRGALARPIAGCAAGRRFAAIDAAGRFKACSHLAGADASESLLDFWHGSPLLSSLRALEETIEPPCAGCPSLSECRGCRALAPGDRGERDCWRQA